MPSNVFKQDEVSKAGFSLTNKSLNWNGTKDKLFTTLTSADGKTTRVYANADLIKGWDQTKESFSIPKDWVFIEMIRPDGNFFILGVDKRKALPSKAPEQLPCKIGDTVMLKEVDEEFEVVYTSRDVMILTSKRLCQLYLTNAATHPTLTRFWDKFSHVVNLTEVENVTEKEEQHINSLPLEG